MCGRVKGRVAIITASTAATTSTASLLRLRWNERNRPPAISEAWHCGQTRYSCSTT